MSNNLRRPPNFAQKLSAGRLPISGLKPLFPPEMHRVMPLAYRARRRNVSCGNRHAARPQARGASSKDRLRKDLAAILAGVAALLITLSTIGNFEGKWRANRLAASAVEGAVYDLAAGADAQGVLSRLRDINLAQDTAIAGSRGAPSR